jgi:hypothetical protein
MPIILATWGVEIGKIAQTTNVGKDEGEKKPSYTAGGNVN